MKVFSGSSFSARTRKRAARFILLATEVDLRQLNAYFGIVWIAAMAGNQGFDRARHQALALHDGGQHQIGPGERGNACIDLTQTCAAALVWPLRE